MQALMPLLRNLPTVNPRVLPQVSQPSSLYALGPQAVEKSVSGFLAGVLGIDAFLISVTDYVLSPGLKPHSISLLLTLGTLCTADDTGSYR